MKQMPGNLILFILLVSLLMAANCHADTGTYRITDYSVTLNPKPNGEVVMDYSQTWLVTGGNIPWVTVGLANANYQIISWGGAAKTVSNGNEGDWFGARVDLNKNYLPNEKFTYNFTIVQRNLISQRSNGYSIVFTPGWYDRSTIDKLSLKVISPIDLLNVTTDPKPSATAGRTLVFSKNNLGMGERYKISVNFLKSALFKVPAQSPQSPQSPQSGWNSPLLILLVIIVGVILVAYYYSIHPDDSYYQDYGGPVVSTGGIRRGMGSDEDHSSGGSGAFGGRASSCACVSCACACACACAGGGGGGGGGAGCARKWRHFCNKCGDPQYPSLLDVTEKEEMGDGK
jgi:hypothetical protein